MKKQTYSIVWCIKCDNSVHLEGHKHSTEEIGDASGVFWDSLRKHDGFEVTERTTFVNEKELSKK